MLKHTNNLLLHDALGPTPHLHARQLAQPQGMGVDSAHTLKQYDSTSSTAAASTLTPCGTQGAAADSYLSLPSRTHGQEDPQGATRSRHSHIKHTPADRTAACAAWLLRTQLLLRALHTLPARHVVVLVAVICVAAAVLPGQAVPVLHLLLKVSHAVQAALLCILVHRCCAVGCCCVWAWQHQAECRGLLWLDAVWELHL